MRHPVEYVLLADVLIDLIVQELQPSMSCDNQGGNACSGCGLCAVRRESSTRSIIGLGATRISARLGIEKIPTDIAKYIDHTLLKPDATPSEIDRLCQEAKEYRFAAVCVNPPFVRRCAELLAGTGVAVAAVIGFPLGAHTLETKVFETQQSVANGATEIDMVINLGELKARNDTAVREDICAVVEAAHRGGAIVKVIIEAALLSDEEKVRACRLSEEAGADFVKTSTGFGPGGATANDVALMRAVVDGHLGVKAAGGIRTYEQVQNMIQAGATRIGASAGVAIVKKARGETITPPQGVGKY